MAMVSQRAYGYSPEEVRPLAGREPVGAAGGDRRLIQIGQVVVTRVSDYADSTPFLTNGYSLVSGSLM